MCVEPPSGAPSRPGGIQRTNLQYERETRDTGIFLVLLKIQLNVFHGGTDTDVTQGQSTHINPATPQSPMCEPLLAIPLKKHDFCRKHKRPPGLGSHVLLAGLSYHSSALWECFTLESKQFCLHWRNHIFKQIFFLDSTKQEFRE